MIVRVRYFPFIFLLLVFAIFLLVPYYYSDTWTTSVWSPSKLDSRPIESITQVPWTPPPVVMQSFNSQQYSNEVEDTKRRVGQKVTTVFPNVFQSIQRGRLLYRGSAIEIGRNFAKLHPRITQYALQMARDRLQIEKFGTLMFHRGNQFHLEGNNSHSVDGKNTSWKFPDTAVATSPSKPPLQVLIVTYFRGGTTFFGDALNQYPGTFYHFEPLHSISINDQVQTPKQEEEAVRILNHLLRCQYSSLLSYISWVRKEDNRFLFEHNRRLWMSCQLHPHLCFDYDFLTAICKLHPIHVFKLVRLRMELATRFLDEYPDLRIIYLARDPRGLYSSRRDLAWCNSTTSCIDPAVYCEDMRRDLKVAKYLNSKYKKRFMAIRYEDIALDPSNQIKKVLEFLKLDYNPKVDYFIETHTHLRAGEDAGGPYSTKRDSRKAAFSWRYKLSPHEIDYVEFSCKDVIKQLALSM